MKRLDKFEQSYEDTMFRLHEESWLKNPGRCRHEWFEFLQQDSLLLEMNSEVFPVPKELLRNLVKDCYENDWKYAYEYAFPRLLRLMKKSSNIDVCDIDWGKMEENEGCFLMLICLPYETNVWKNNLKDFFTGSDIEKLFSIFNGQTGAYGTYSNGHMIILNSDKISTLKECEEVLEHELIHMIEAINGTSHSCSPMMLHILGSTSETKTWIVNLVNALFGLYDHMQTMTSYELDSVDARKKFLDTMFKDAAEAKTPDELWRKYEDFSTSSLLEGNLLFLWRLVQWEPDELQEIIKKIYDEFLKE